MPKTENRKMASRHICLEVIYNVLENGDYLNESIDRALLDNKVTDVRDRAFITMLAGGTVERAVELDYIINMYSSKRADKLKPYIRNILRMAVYQIKYMDRVPDSASVDEAVKLAVKKGYGGLRGYVNGILRNIARTYRDIKYPDMEKEPLKYYSVTYSMPEWITGHFMKELGADGMICGFEYFLSKPELTVRSAKCSREAVSEFAGKLDRSGFSVSRGRIFDYAVRIGNSGRIEDIPGYGEGEFVVQDESSMIPAHAIAEYVKFMEKSGNDVGLKLLDMCAAPGGKALHASALLGGMAEIEARDVSVSKTAMIKENIDRLGIGNVTVRKADALTRYESDRESYDIIIADLPCSGLGVIAKKPDIKYNIKEKELENLASVQLDMLDNAAFYVKRGGIITYSTCTIDRRENEDNCRLFLDRHPEFEQVNLKGLVPAHIREAVTECGSLKVFPGKYMSDGFFVAMFRRRAAN